MTAPPDDQTHALRRPTPRLAVGFDLRGHLEPVEMCDMAIAPFAGASARRPMSLHRRDLEQPAHRPNGWDPRHDTMIFGWYFWPIPGPIGFSTLESW